jgi:transposase
MEGTTFVGLDAHKEWINVAMLLPGRETPIEWQVPNEVGAIRKMLRRIEGEAPGEVRFCYEAGPCGYALQRQITDGSAASCMVVAPSLIPGKPGERVKTDRRDAKKLAFLFRAGMLTEVQPPSEEDEAARDLCRAREDAREDLVRCRHRLTKFLLRRGIVFTGGKRAWTRAHRRWLCALHLQQDWDQVVFSDYLLAVEHLEGRLDTLANRVEQLSQQRRYAVGVAVLRCFRGFDTITATALVVELHTFHRFTSPRKLMAFVGLVPSEHTSGRRRRLGAITKTGNGHVRRLLIEAAWSYRHPPRVGTLARRRKGQPPRVIALADRAMQRLYRRYVRLTLRGVPSQKAIVAVARELVGFVWAALMPLAMGTELPQAS